MLCVVCSGERGTLINGAVADARPHVSVDMTGAEKEPEPQQARSALDLPEITPQDFGPDGEAEQDQFADWLGDASDDEDGASPPIIKGKDVEDRESGDLARLSFSAPEPQAAATAEEREEEEQQPFTKAERRPLFG